MTRQWSQRSFLSATTSCTRVVIPIASIPASIKHVEATMVHEATSPCMRQCPVSHSNVYVFNFTVMHLLCNICLAWSVNARGFHWRSHIYIMNMTLCALAENRFSGEEKGDKFLIWCFKNWILSLSGESQVFIVNPRRFINLLLT